MNKYLPSKQFMSRIIILLLVIFFVWGIFQITKLFTRDNKKEKTEKVLVVKDLIQKDSNDNGVADWEEGLWGLDPYKNGPENKQFILAKRSFLQKDNTIIHETDDTQLTENDVLSRELFATIMSLAQSNSLNPDSIQSVSEAIGENIIPADIPDIYTKNMIKIGGTEAEYYLAFNKLVEKYKDKEMGSELSFVAQGLGNKDPQALYLAKSMAIFYREFGQTLIKTPAPASLAPINLSLANNYEKVAQTIEGFSFVLTDQIAGMRSLINYKKYSDAIISGITKLSDNLE